jgi:superfamily II DNA or RNA helicase
MYNNSSKTVPLKTPVHLQVLLRPWFDEKCLQEGLDLIREGKIHHFFFYRHAAAGLLNGSQPLHIVFTTTAKIRQGFTLQKESCEFCGPEITRNKKRCSHLAALTMLSLITRESDERNTFPIPLHFEKTGWNQIGGFLYTWLKRQPGKTLRKLNNDHFLLQKESSQEGLRLKLPSFMESQWKSFFTDTPETEEEHLLHSLRKEMKRLTLTENEYQLSHMNTETQGSKRDASVWSWICRDLALKGNGTLPVFQYNAANKRIVLVLIQDDTELIITLPKSRTWELLSSLRDYGLDVPLLPPAQECFQVDFLPSGAIRVIPSLRMDDDQFTAANELDEQKMGSCYYLPERGFLPIKKQSGAGIIKHPDHSGQTNLFDFAKRSLEQTQEFTIETNLIPQFLQQNSTPLRHPDNNVDHAVLEIKTISLPRELIIETFDEDQDWCYLSCHYGMGDATIALEDILTAVTAKASFIPGKEWLDLSDSPLSWLHNLLPERLIQRNNGKDNVLRLRPSELLALTSLVPEVRNNVKEKDFRRQLKALLDCDSWSDESLLHDCPDHLRSYQRNGLAWLSSLYRFGLGGLLADDMGLGKTHQGLALLDAIRKQSKNQHSAGLVICPASVLCHWRNKIDAFYPQLSYTIYYGPGRNLDTASSTGLLITTYTIARIDQELLTEIPFDIILLDEIQNLKNSNTGIHKAVATLNAKVKIGLTGTPIENSLTDLHSLFSLCLPGFFGSAKNFSTNFLVPIKDHKNKKVAERLRRLIHPFILRRNRKQVLTELPALTIDDRTCELSESQVKLYRDVVDESVELLDEVETEDSSIKYINILAMLTRLKQICNHPCLLEGCIDAEQHESGKWNLFIELLSECLNADLKVVVFSQYTGMLDIIEHYLKQAGIDYASLRGNMAVTVREKMLRKFSDDPKCSVFCASLLAGGTGIDLVAAQVVIHYDRWWNPAKEAQATARVHRMGQKQPVQVFRLITTGTLEEKIHNLLKCKQEMANSLISEDEDGVIKKLDRRRLQELFRLG